MPIYGVGMPTVGGVRGVLQTVSGAGLQGTAETARALWVNMREEPMVCVCVCVNGSLSVLREEVGELTGGAHSVCQRVAFVLRKEDRARLHAS